MADPRRILVTGCSTGIGRASALALLARGHFVFATVRDPAAPGSLRAEAAGLPGQLEMLPLDVRSDASVTAAVGEAVRRAGEVGGLDVLVNNAGLGAAPAAVEETAPATLLSLLDTNVAGVHRVTRAALPALRARHGRVVNVGSTSGRLSRPFNGAYAASKFALEALTDALHWELRPLGVEVTLVEPGFVETAFGRNRLPAAVAAESPYQAHQAQVAALLARLLSDPTPVAEVARVVADAAEGLSPRRRRHVVGRDAATLLAAAAALSEDAGEAGFEDALRGLADAYFSGRLGPASHPPPSAW
jgi:NAD(P)-dependent dehydrogenase (short-subunit alcohol dehydrogenase family)